jgi:hypothetical protein
LSAYCTPTPEKGSGGKKSQAKVASLASSRA